MARFIPAWEDPAPRFTSIRDVAGFREQMGDGWDYYVTTTAWKEVLRRPRSAADRGDAETEGPHRCGEGAHIAKTVRVPDHGKMRLYHIRSTFLEDANDA